jgi:Conserved in the green lineage and diatoms 27
MNLNIKIFLLCPVPEEQKPIHEYLQLKENDFTNWVTFGKKQYFQKLASFTLNLFGFFSLLQFSKYQEVDYLLETLLETLLWSLLGVSFLFLVNFARWKQVEIRFRKSRLFYEEASWYDGQIWEKPLGIVKNDKLVSTQKIQPLLQRILRTLFTLLAGILFLSILLQVL